MPVTILLPTEARAVFAPRRAACSTVGEGVRGCAFWRQNAPRGAARSSGAPETQLARTGGQAGGASGAGARAAAVGDRARMSRRGRRRCAAARQLSPRNCHRTLLTCAACRRSALRLSSRHLSKVAHPLPVPALACRLRVACVSLACAFLRRAAGTGAACGCKVTGARVQNFSIARQPWTRS